jgi:arylsulfatase A-like enzyme
MSEATPATLDLSAPRSMPERERRARARDVLFFSAWCGLAGGWLEVAVRVLCHAVDPTHRLYQLSRHFVWLSPLANFSLFLGLGLIMALLTRLWARLGAWLGPRVACTLGLLPALCVAGPRIYCAAWLIVALGMAVLLVRRLERRRARWWPRLMWSFPVLFGLVALVASFMYGADKIDQWREARRPMAAAGSPNVLLIVLDTVRADRLSLYGYHRATSPNLERLAKRGIRFDAARATAPWTLPSHASMFTGRLPHELAVEWMTPLRSSFPTLAEYLRARGYATAGFAANALYCSYDSGLARGFTHYEDYVLDGLLSPRMASILEPAKRAIFELDAFLNEKIVESHLGDEVGSWLQRITDSPRRRAKSINRAMLDWLSQRHDSQRPFFVFLNYVDAHSPYVAPGAAARPFGLRPHTKADFLFLTEHWTFLDKTKVSPRFQTLAQDSYDNCLSYLDEQLGALVDELERRGDLNRTLLIVTSDHGEGLGEHKLYDHGESLYRTEIHVPLLFMLPAGGRVAGVVRKTVSLRDLPATIVDLVGLAEAAPFPGRSLSRFWNAPSPVGGPAAESEAVSELHKLNPADTNQGRSPCSRGPLVALAAGDFVYIRNEVDGTEELYNEREDPHELINRATHDDLQPLLKQFRDRRKQLEPTRLR